MSTDISSILKSLQIGPTSPGAFGRGFTGGSGGVLESRSPIDRALLGTVRTATVAEYEQVVAGAEATFKAWRLVPAPERGQVVRRIGETLRDHKQALGALVSWEVGKILAEGEGEIQEAIDIADFAVGLSRQLYGKSMHSERRAHRMYEQWHPLGPVGVITAFNFPAAVWAWNAMLAAVCGDVVIWKPSELSPLVAVAMHQLCARVAEELGHPGVFNLVIGDGPALGERLAADRRVPLISATGSCRMGRSVATVVANRLGRSILELGGNNAVVVLKDADLGMAVRSTLFGAVGTAGQRCTSTRRILVAREIADEFTAQLAGAYRQVRIGNPLLPGTLMGPLIHERAVEAYRGALAAATAQGGRVVCGGEVVSGLGSNLYVQPAIVQAHRGMEIVREETFAPILYIIPVQDLEEAIEANNEVPQGLSSAIFTRNMLKSAAHSVARRIPAGDVSQGRTPGSSTCAGRLIRSTGVMTCPLLRGSRLIFDL